MITEPASPTSPATLDQLRPALADSAARLANLVGPLTPEGVRGPSYCSEWSVADVLSHLGSGAVIFRRRLDDDADLDTQAVWDAWNAKSPDEQASDCLLADGALLKVVAALGAGSDRRFSMGPFDLDEATFLSLRLNEHVIHTWDIEVSLDPAATIPEAAAGLIVDSLGIMAGLVGKPTGTEKTFTVRTSAPTRQFELAIRADGVSLSPVAVADGPLPDSANALNLSADALIRLVYGRLAVTDGAADGSPELGELRQVFPGF